MLVFSLRFRVGQSWQVCLPILLLAPLEAGHFDLTARHPGGVALVGAAIEWDVQISACPRS